MTMLSRLIRRERSGEPPIAVAVVGAGLIGRGLMHQLQQVPGMRTALVVTRTPQKAVAAFQQIGYSREQIVVSDDRRTLARAIASGLPAVTREPELIARLNALDVVVEMTGAVEYGARIALLAIESGKHIVMMNAETDATVGCALKARADRAGVVYTNSDGDQPGVLNRLCEYVRMLGLEVTAAMNCKGFLDRQATPETIRAWAEKQRTSLGMTTAFTDGTKMNIENAVVANATGLLPQVRGMRGVPTDLEHALEDCINTFNLPRQPAPSRQLDGHNSGGVVDYTLGGDFGGGVFVIGRGDDPNFIQPYLQYFKMGSGPYYLFYRPYHLCHFETPLSIADAALYGEPTIAPLGSPQAEVITLAKRDLEPGEVLDGIGGYTCYGEIDVIDRTDGLLPIGLSEGAIVTRPLRAGEPIPLDALDLADDTILWQLYREQFPKHRLRPRTPAPAPAPGSMATTAPASEAATPTRANSAGQA